MHTVFSFPATLTTLYGSKNHTTRHVFPIILTITAFCRWRHSLQYTTSHPLSFLRDSRIQTEILIFLLISNKLARTILWAKISAGGLTGKYLMMGNRRWLKGDTWTYTRSSRKDGYVRFLFGFSDPVYTADVKRQRLPAVQLAPTNLFLAWGATIIGWFCVSCLTFHTSICSLASSHLSSMRAFVRDL